jgi:hypothetical protein
MAEGYSSTQIKEFIEGIGKASEHLRQNVNVRLALEVLMLDIPSMKEGGSVKNG